MTSGCDSRSVLVKVTTRPATRPADSLVVRVSDTTGSSAPTYFDLPVDFDGTTSFVIAADGRSDDLGIELALCADGIPIAATTGSAPSGEGEVSVQLSPLDFQVNSTFEGTQWAAVGGALAVGSDGSFLAAWDSDEGGIEVKARARLFDPTTAPTPHAGSQDTADFVVGSSQRDTDPATARQGDVYLVAWKETQAGDGTMDLVSDVWSRDGSGGLSGRLVNETAAYDITAPQVAAVGSDRFVVAWAQIDDGGILSRAHYRVVTSAGNPVTADIPLGVPMDAEQQAIAVASHTAGFVLVWNEISDTGAGSVFAQRFDTGGSSIGAAVEVETLSEGLDQPELTASSVPGGFAVGWTINYGEEARFRRFDDDGTAQSDAKTLAVAPGSTLGGVTMTTIADDMFALSYTRSGQDASDTTAWLVTVSNTGDTISTPTRLSNLAASNVQSSSLRGLPGGALLVAWTDQLDTEDMAGTGIRARILYPPYAVEPAPSLSCVPNAAASQ